MFQIRLRTVLIVVALSAVWLQWNQGWLSAWLSLDASDVETITTIAEFKELVESDRSLVININYSWSPTCQMVSQAMKDYPSRNATYPLNQFDLIEVDVAGEALRSWDEIQEIENLLTTLHRQDEEVPKLMRMNTYGLVFWKIENRLYWLDGIHGRLAEIDSQIKSKTLSVLGREGVRKPLGFAPWLLLVICTALLGRDVVRGFANRTKLNALDNTKESI